MASAATTIIRRIAPEFAAVTDDEVDAWVEIAALQHSAAPFGATFTLAMAYYTAHLMSRAGLGANAATASAASTGGVAGVREQDLSVVYDILSPQQAALKVSTASDVDLTSTRYGLRYLAIRGSRATVGATVLRVTD